jgi:hypothetical protein
MLGKRLGSQLATTDWFHILFLVDCSSYDVDLGLKDSLALFKQIVNKFQRCNLFLFLNKQDVLAERVTSGNSRLEKYFPDFSDNSIFGDDVSNSGDDPEYERAKYFIRDQYLRVLSDGEYNSWGWNCRFRVYFTSATSKVSVNMAFKDCERNADESGLHNPNCMCMCPIN